MVDVTAELKWLRALLRTLRVSHSHAISLFCDSKSTLYIAHNPVFHECTKHIEVDCHYICDAIYDGLIVTSHISTTNQLADIFTKALGIRQFLFLHGKLRISNPHAPT